MITARKMQAKPFIFLPSIQEYVKKIQNEIADSSLKLFNVQQELARKKLEWDQLKTELSFDQQALEQIFNEYKKTPVFAASIYASGKYSEAIKIKLEKIFLLLANVDALTKETHSLEMIKNENLRILPETTELIPMSQAESVGGNLASARLSVLTPAMMEIDSDEKTPSPLSRRIVPSAMFIPIKESEDPIPNHHKPKNESDVPSNYLSQVKKVPGIRK